MGHMLGPGALEVQVECTLSQGLPGLALPALSCVTWAGAILL